MGISTLGVIAMFAAAISWNMVEHNITVRMQGNVEKAAKVDINAENKSDFRAYATAAAVSLSKVDYMVAAGVALMDNDNDTHIIIGRDGEDAPHSKINASGDINELAEEVIKRVQATL